MRVERIAFAVSILLPVCGWASPAIAGAKAVERYRTHVEGQPFKVVRYDDNSVKVIVGGFLGTAYSFKLRNKMRQAAKQTTGCDVADDFDQDGKLIGKLVCGGASAS